MILVAAYLLRQKTRPTNEESYALMGACLVERHRKEFLQSLSREGDALNPRVHVSNLTDARPVDTCFNDFIRKEGGGRYLDHPAAFEVVTHAFESGELREPTRLALVFARSVEEMQGSETLPSRFEPFMERGRQWEALGRWGDAALCYAVALRVAGVHPELNVRLGRALTHHPRELGAAVRALDQAAEALPARADVQAALARCYIAIADHEEVPVAGVERRDLRSMAVARLEAAARLDPKNSQVAEDLAAQRQLLGQGPEESFYE